jgi:GT2 family glycosyltransferase
MPQFSIIIVSWNALHHLQTFLPSIAASHYPDFEIILADNASTDDSRQWVARHYPSVKIVTFDHNYGYCGGNNRAAPYADGDILLFLNNDVKVDPDWLPPLAKYFEEHEQTAAVQPKIRSYQEPDKFEYAGAAGGFIDRYGYPFCRGRIFDTIEKDEGQFEESANIFWASGAAFAIRHEVFREMGGFDEAFEFHMEEIDLCWRLWNQGYTVAYCPDSVVYHVGGGSLPMHSPRKLYYNYRNSLMMLWKNYSTSSLFLRFPIRMMLDLTALFRELFTGNFNACKAIIRAYVHFWRSLPKTAVKRSYLQQERMNKKNPQTMQPISIVWQYFIKGRKYFNGLLN